MNHINVAWWRHKPREPGTAKVTTVIEGKPLAWIEFDPKQLKGLIDQLTSALIGITPVETPCQDQTKPSTASVSTSRPRRRKPLAK